MYTEHVGEASFCQCSPLPCAQNGKQHKNPGLQLGSHETLTRSTLSVLLFPSQRLCHILSERHFRQSREPAAGWMGSSSSDSQLRVAGCTPITLIKRSVLPLGDGCVRLLDRECQMPRSGATRMSCQHHQTDVGPYFSTLHEKHPFLAPFHKSSSGQDFR